MKAYKYNEETKKYEGEVMRHRDPLESQKAGHDVWLMPANATDVEPLEPKEGFDIVWNGNAWKYQEIPQPEPEPEPTKEQKQRTVRDIRNVYLASTDFTQLGDAPLTDVEKANYIEYRQYLRDYTKTENWWEQEPATYEDWLVAQHPVAE